ncbi:MAG: nucleoside triphosphate pyrophosphohydrolase [Lentisphaeria bacterium]|nr:nucleoside triphosphate pyrophosphohydrolase [Lentisphaeria bacterium]
MADGQQFSPDAEGLMAVLRRLRAPDGCPWDRAQTRHTLTRHLAGECAELIDAIDREDPPGICDEAGDVLMNLFLQILIAEERGEFTLTDVWKNEIAKMVRRHAHIFGDASASTPEEVTALWEKIKQRERADKPAPESVLDDVPHYLSALARAEKLQKKAAKTGFDWSEESGVLDKIKEEVEELSQAMAAKDADAVDEELGDLLFAAVNLVRFRDREDSEALLRRACRKFERRFRYIEKNLKAAGESPGTAGLGRMEALWQAAKTGEKE